MAAAGARFRQTGDAGGGLRRQSVRSLLALRQQLLEATGQISQIGRHLIRTWQPDVCCLVLGAAHRAGHYLWNTSQLDGEKDGASTAVFPSPIEGSGSTWV